MASASQTLSFSVFLLLVITCETQANTALIGEWCSVDRNCISEQTICDAGTCRCFRGHNPSNDGRTCIPTTRGLCFDESDCRSLQSSSCFILDALEGTCTCREGFSSSTDAMRCLSHSTNLGPCEENVQCTSPLGDAMCTAGRCECQRDNHFSLLDRRCIRSVGLQGNCQNSSQCVADGSQSNVFCDNGSCACNPGFVQVQDSCRAGAQNVVVSGAVFLLYWIIKFVIS